MFLKPFNHYFKPSRLVWRGPRLEDAIDRGVDPEVLGRGKMEMAIKESQTKQEELRNDVELGLEITDKLSNKKKVILKFIEEHQDYKSGDWRQWNEEFLQMMGEEDSQFIDHIQLKLFGDQTKVDSKLGPKTLKALSRYLILGLDSKKVVHIRDVRKLEVTETLSDLDKEQLFELYKKALTNELDQASDGLEIDDEMTYLKKDPQEDGPAKVFYSKIEQVISNNPVMDTSSVDGWRKAFKNASLSNSEIEKMGLRMEPSVSENISPQTEAKKTLNFEDIKLIAKDPIDKFNTNSQELHDEIRSERNEVEELLKPGERHYSFYRNLLPKPLKEAAQKYKEAYLEWEPVSDLTEGFEDQLNAKNNAFKDLVDATKKYYDKLDSLTKINSEFDQEFESRLKELSTHYYLLQSPTLDDIKILHKNASYFPVVQRYLLDSPAVTAPTTSREAFVQLLKGNSLTEKEANFKKMQDEMNLDEAGIINSYNNRIYSVNIYNFNEKAKDLASEIQNKRILEIQKIKNMTKDELLNS